MPEALVRPVWSALTTGWQAYAEGDARAWRLRRDLGVFGAAADGSAESLAALAALVPADGELWTVEPEGWPRPPGLKVVKEAVCVQMLADVIPAGSPPGFDIVPLYDTDAPEMFALATLTQPGPYVARSDRLGRFFGVRENGQLIAMAGERMRMPGLAEVSAVCTHPDHRCRGLARMLMCHVAQQMVDHDERPFLHAYASNSGAIALYETLGFRRCGEVVATALSR